MFVSKFYKQKLIINNVNFNIDNYSSTAQYLDNNLAEVCYPTPTCAARVNVVFLQLSMFTSWVMFISWTYLSDVIIVIWAMRLSAYGPFVFSALHSRFFCSYVSYPYIVYCACITILFYLWVSIKCFVSEVKYTWRAASSINIGNYTRTLQ